MRISEGQVRQLIRKVLREARRASNWETYIEYTSEDHDIPKDEVAAMVDQYKDMMSKIKSQKGEAIDYLVTNFKLDPNQSDSYKDWVKWYMNYNSSPDGRVLADGKKWIDVEDVLSIMEAMHDSLITKPPPSDVAGEMPKVRKQRFKKWIGKRIEKAKARAANRRAKRTTRKIDRMDKKIDKKAEKLKTKYNQSEEDIKRREEEEETRRREKELAVKLGTEEDRDDWDKRQL